VADDDDLLAAPVDRCADVVDARSGSKALVGLGLDAERSRELVAGLARPKQWAREDDGRLSVLVAKPLAERSRLLASFLRQRAQLVGLSRPSLGVSDEVEAHES
jgi:hypothetical protein